MEGMKVQMKLNPIAIDVVNATMNDLVAKGTDLSPAYKKFTPFIHRKTVRAFDTRGRIPNSWPPYAPLTLVLRKASGRGRPRGMLQREGILKGSLAARYAQQEMWYGTSVPYAALQQFGGKSSLTLPAVTIVPKKAKALRFVARSGEVVFARRVQLPRRTMTTTIPPRKFLDFTHDDHTYLLNVISNHFAERRR